MRINTNITALTACRNLGLADRNASESLKRLSSGYKINSSKDNPVGAAISARMKSQIKNLEKSTQSTADGVSVIESAESVLGEVHSIVQRMRELCVQGANDTYTEKDRESIMSEIDQLRMEIDRVSEDTDFNTKNLLNGDLGRRTYTNIANVDISYVSVEVSSGEYELHITDEATKAEYTSGAVTGGVSGRFSVNGVYVSVEATDTVTEIYEKVRTAADRSGIDVTMDGDKFVYQSTRYGAKHEVEIKCDDERLQNALGLDSEEISEVGSDVEVSIVSTGLSSFTASATAACDGNTVVVTDNGGFKMRIDIGENIVGDRIIAHVTDVGAMTVQVGANEGQDLDIDIPRVNCEMMGLDDLIAYTSRGAENGITICDGAIEYISEVRSRIGAYQNRLEHTQASLETTTENMTSALSRITDVDMAKEMTDYTTQNVITQAATSMLAQANQMPEKILQLLQ